MSNSESLGAHVFITSVTADHQLRKRQQHVIQVLNVLKVPHTVHDIAQNSKVKVELQAANQKPVAIQSALTRKWISAEEFDEAVEDGCLPVLLNQ